MRLICWPAGRFSQTASFFFRKWSSLVTMRRGARNSRQLPRSDVHATTVLFVQGLPELEDPEATRWLVRAYIRRFSSLPLWACYEASAVVGLLAFYCFLVKHGHVAACKVVHIRREAEHRALPPYGGCSSPIHRRSRTSIGAAEEGEGDSPREDRHAW